MVNQMNDKQLKALRGKEMLIPAVLLHKSITNFNPPTNNAGNILNTPFKKELKLKIGVYSWGEDRKFAIQLPSLSRVA